MALHLIFRGVHAQNVVLKAVLRMDLNAAHLTRVLLLDILVVGVRPLVKAELVRRVEGCLARLALLDHVVIEYPVSLQGGVAWFT